MQALRVALADDPGRIWNESNTFGFPLAAAAAGNHENMVHTIVKYFEQTQHRTRMMKIKRNFLRAISAALDTKSASIASLLLQVFGAYACPEAEPTVASWMEKALSMRNRDLILQIRNPRRSGSFEATTAFQEACAADDLVAVRMFVEEGLMPLHCTISYGPQFTPIQIAVTSRSAKSVELLLKMGADPNGECVYDGVLDRPLWLAMESNDEDIVHLLLEQGGGR